MIIETSQPALNRQGGKLSNAEQYVQYIDMENLWPNQQDMLIEMHEGIETILKKLEKKTKVNFEFGIIGN